MSFWYNTCAKEVMLLIPSFGLLARASSKCLWNCGLRCFVSWCSKVGNKKNFSLSTTKPDESSRIHPFLNSTVWSPFSRALTTVAHSFSAFIIHRTVLFSNNSQIQYLFYSSLPPRTSMHRFQQCILVMAFHLLQP